MPGDPFSYTSSVSGDDMDTAYSKEQLEQLRAYYGLDKPISTQLLETVKKNISGDLGESIYYKKAVTDVLKQRLSWSLYIMYSSLGIALVCGTMLALYCINHPKTDKIFYSVNSFIAEIPTFLVGVFLLFHIAARFKGIPLSGAVTPFTEYIGIGDRIKDILVHSVLPVTSLAITLTPAFFFTARASFLSTQNMPYVFCARTKGLSKTLISYKYILKNSCAPIISKFFLSAGTAVGGTILVENVFAYPGLGRVLREAVMYRDYMMIQGVFLLSSIFVLLSLFIADTINTGQGKRIFKAKGGSL